MAQPIQFTPRPARTEPTAEEEWSKLLQTCHEHGLLRLANDLVGSNVEVTRLLLEKASSPEILNLIQNLSVLAMALGSISPDRLHKLVFATRDAAAALVGDTPHPAAQRPEPKPPGMIGAWRLLHDEPFWRGMAPLLEALKAFGQGLRKPDQPPVSAWSGKAARSG